jgi:RNA-directed DNA polymerase
MPNPRVLSALLARCFLASEPSVESITARSNAVLGKPWRWIPSLAARYLKAFPASTRPRHSDVIRFLAADAWFRRARKKYAAELETARWLTPPQQMQPAPVAARWNVPAIESPGALAQWLELNINDLLWFADLKGLGGKQGERARLHHYHYRVLSKKSGSIRLIEIPKPRLKEIQHRILTGILENIPPHPTAQGFVKSRSILTFVMPHVGRRVVLRMDLCDFFPSIAAARIQSFFRTTGYPEPVADLLGGLCTNAAPQTLWRATAPPLDAALLRDARALYRRPHLPQGAPTSPALANICMHRADCRLSGLAASAGATYTRYADDLAFSGGEDFDRRIERFSTHVAAILHEEGFTVHHR